MAHHHHHYDNGYSSPDTALALPKFHPFTRDLNTGAELSKLDPHSTGAENGYLSTHPSLSFTQSITLRSYSEIPSYLKGNPYIVHGYRVNLPLHLCLKSLCLLTNETVNIWSHLVGCLFFVALSIYSSVFVFPHLKASYMDYLMFLSSSFCFQVCMLCSCGYHLFGCQSELKHSSWLAADITGICIGLLGCYFSGVYYAFYCHPFWCRCYILLACLLTMVTMLLLFYPKEHHRPRRVFLFLTLALFGVIPATHWVYLYGTDSLVVQLFLSKIYGLYAMAFLAFFFYLTKIPERYFPGQVDFIGHSHQLWHVLVFLAFFWWYLSGVEFFNYWINNPCPVTE